MGGKHVVGAKHLLDSHLETVECLTAGIRIVSNVHGRSLAVGHGIDTAVGEHIHIDVLVLEQEGVVTGLLYFLQTLLHRQEGEFLYYTHLVHFQGHLIL